MCFARTIPSNLFLLSTAVLRTPQWKIFKKDLTVVCIPKFLGLWLVWKWWDCNQSMNIRKTEYCRCSHKTYYIYLFSSERNTLKKISRLYPYFWCEKSIIYLFLIFKTDPFIFNLIPFEFISDHNFILSAFSPSTTAVRYVFFLCPYRDCHFWSGYRDLHWQESLPTIFQQPNEHSKIHSFLVWFCTQARSKISFLA